ncbi:MAG: hypothetical protein AAF616_00590 [Bacteroidota bacterium]
MRSAAFLIVFLFVFACNKNSCESDLPATSVSLNVQRLDLELMQASSPERIVDILNQNEDFARLFLDVDQYPSTEVLAERMFTLFQEPSIDTLFEESQEAFRDFESLVNQLEAALGRLGAYFPTAQVPKLQTAVTGLYKDLVITNEQIIIGMDFFIGPQASYPPMQIPVYIQKRYTTEYLPANILQFISSQFITQSKGETMLAEMIDHGKSYFLLSKLLPCTEDRILIGYSQQEWEDSSENDHIIWANFIENELLYDTDHQMKQKFLGERPNVYEIGKNCPGRIGRWLGWQIVKSYAERTNCSVQDLLALQDANEVLRISGYKPSSS